jgi:hypothetical protein
LGYCPRLTEFAHDILEFVGNGIADGVWVWAYRALDGAAVGRRR